MRSEVILTVGRSNTVKSFLLAARQDARQFKVFVAEGAPGKQGHVSRLRVAPLRLSVSLSLIAYPPVSRLRSRWPASWSRPALRRC